MEIEKIVGRLRNLPKYEGLTDSEIRKIALKEFYKNTKINFDLENLFTDKEELKLARDLEKKYLENFKIETVSEKNLLTQLIYLEIFHLRLQKSANAFDGNIGGVPGNLLDNLHKNINQIILLKERLGIGKKKEEETIDDFTTLEILKKKFKVWQEENSGTRSLNCPHCGQYILLKIKTDSWEAGKHPYFKDKLLTNEHLMYLYITHKITKEDVAKILGTSPDYTDWLVEKMWNKNKEYQELVQENTEPIETKEVANSAIEQTTLTS